MSKDDLKSKKSTNFAIRQRRVFSTDFKRQKVAEITSGEISIANFSKLWGISKHIIYKWIYKYSPEHKKAGRPVLDYDGYSIRQRGNKNTGIIATNFGIRTHISGSPLRVKSK